MTFYLPVEYRSLLLTYGYNQKNGEQYRRIEILGGTIFLQKQKKIFFSHQKLQFSFTLHFRPINTKRDHFHLLVVNEYFFASNIVYFILQK